MAISKVVLNGTTLMDATTATATAEDIIAPKTALIATGEMTEGTGSGGEWTTNGIAWGTEPSGDIVIDFEQIQERCMIRSYAFRGRGQITSVVGYQKFWNYSNPIGSNAFYDCTGLQSISFPDLDNFMNTTQTDQFRGCTALTSVNLPKLTKIMPAMFRGCTALPKVVLPLAEYLYAQAFMSCSSLTQVDIKGGSFANDVFNGCSSLSVIVIRNSSSVPSLGNINTFTGTPFASGGTGGTIYIPKALYDHLGDGTSSDYKAATNWSTVDGYGTITWAQIEGSIYENAYVDGAAIN